MLHESFIHPKTIAVVGGSDKLQKPGGSIVRNLVEGRFKGDIHVINPKLKELNGCICHADIEEIRIEIDLGILAVPSGLCKSAIEQLNLHSKTRSFIIISAGFSEIGAEGQSVEQEILEYAVKNNIQIFGPNCIGLLSKYHSGVFTTPVPEFANEGVDLISASGATAVFLMEEGLTHGMSFGSVFSVGNGLMIRIEDILEYLDANYHKESSAPVKLLYLESISNPEKFYRHCASLVNKGCRIAAIKAGRTRKGIEAATSHTAAISNPDDAIQSIFHKCGVIRCYSRQELITAGMILSHNHLEGNHIAVVTHAGGPGVLLADQLSEEGFELPTPTEKDQTKLISEILPGSSVKNPFDILATGTRNELEKVLNFVRQESVYDGVVVIFGSPGLFNEIPIFELIRDYQIKSTKPIFTIIPSSMNAKVEARHYKSIGGCYFEEEKILAQALSSVLKHEKRPGGVLIHFPFHGEASSFISNDKAIRWLEKFEIPIVRHAMISHLSEAEGFFNVFKKKVVLKALDLHHKTDQDAVFTGLSSVIDLKKAIDTLREVCDAPYLIQEQLSGHEIYLGIKRYDKFGWMMYLGEGGINIELSDDLQSGLIPLSEEEILYMIDQLAVSRLWKGYRKQKKVNLEGLVEIIDSVQQLILAHPEILELDINPLIASGDNLSVVDVRIKTLT